MSEEAGQPALPGDVPSLRAALIRAAIGQLEEGNESHWTKDGRPEVAALKAVSGARVGELEGARRRLGGGVRGGLIAGAAAMYATRADLVARFSAAEIDGLDTDAGRLDARLADASAEIDACLYPVYELPVGRRPLAAAPRDRLRDRALPALRRPRRRSASGARR